MKEDYYAVLGVQKNATTKQIRERFLQLARERHPDRIVERDKQAAELAFQKITEAYNVLHDVHRRRLYDQEVALRSRAPAETVTTQAARVYLRRGVEALKKNHLQEALHNFDQATKEDPEDAQAWHYLATIYSQRSTGLNRGVAASAKACELEPMNPKYLKLAGSLASRVGLAARAMKYYTDALTFGGEDPEVRQALSELKRTVAKEDS